MAWEFWRYDDDYTVLKRAGMVGRSVDAISYYSNLSKTIEVDGRAKSLSDFHMSVMRERIHMHRQWCECGRPYLKVFPSIAAYLSKVSIQFPAERLVMPYPAFEIALPKTDNVFQEGDDTPALRGVMVSTSMNGRLHIFMDFGVRGDDDAPLTLQLEQFIPLTEGQTIDEILDDLQHWSRREWEVRQVVARLKGETPLPAPYHPSKEFSKSIMALVVSAIFFMSGRHKEVAPDITQRLMHKYLAAKARGKAGEADLKKVIEESRRAGHTGYTVGKEIELPRDVVVRHYEARKTGQTWEHRFGHWRGCVWRMQPYGPRDNPTYEPILIMPCRIRGDLPLKPGDHGFVIPDDRLPLEKT